MSLGIYLDVVASEEISSGTRTRPLSLTFEGRAGGTKEIKLYIRNDSSSYFYEDIVLSLEDTGSDSRIDGSLTGFTWKLVAGDTKPTANDWLHTDAGEDITLTDLGSSGSPNTSTYLPFWLQVTVPANTSVQTIDSINFILTATENAV